MRSLLSLLVFFVLASVSLASGSIGWDDVSMRLSHDAPDLIKVINDAFDVYRVGDALRLGPRSSDVIDGRAQAGTRVPPYEFYCKPKGARGPFSLQITIHSDGEWYFIIRFKGKPHA